MFTEKDILARLQNGESADAIANEMADMINKANKLYADEVAKQDKVQKEKEMDEILCSVCAWFRKYYDKPEFTLEKIKPEQVIDLVDALIDYVDCTKELFDFIKKPAKAPVKSTIKVGNTADETIADFLNKMGW